MSNLASVWSESGTVADGIVLSLAAVDQEAVDAAEARDFVRHLRTPSDPRDPNAGTRAGCLYALAVPVLLLCGAILAGLFAEMGLPSLVGLLIPPAAAASVLLTRFWRAHSVRRVRAQQERSFTFEATSSKLVLRADDRVRYEVPTDMIAGIVGGARLSIQRTDGRLDVLPLRIASGGHDALAARLTEIVREARALGGGYRGHERVRVSTDEEEALDDEEVVAEKQRRR